MPSAPAPDLVPDLAPDRSPGLGPGFASRLFLTGALAFVALGMLPALLGAALPGWREGLALGAGEGGTVTTVLNAGAVATVLAGIAGLPGLGLRLALGLLALGAAGVALAPGWGAILGGAFVAGLGYGILAVAVNRRFLMAFGARGPGMVGLVNGLFGAGAILAPLLFLAAGRPAPVLWGVAAVAIAALLLATPEPEGARASGLPPLRLRHLLLLANMAAVMMETALIGLGASALVDGGISEAGAARLVSAFFATYVVARLSLYWLAARVPPERLFLGAVVGMTACAGLATLSPAWGFALAGGFAGITFPAFFIWGSRAFGTDPRVGALILASGLGGAALGPLGLRPILARTGEEGMFGIVAIIGACLTLVLLILARPLGRLARP